MFSGGFASMDVILLKLEKGMVDDKCYSVLQIVIISSRKYCNLMKSQIMKKHYQVTMHGHVTWLVGVHVMLQRDENRGLCQLYLPSVVTP